MASHQSIEPEEVDELLTVLADPHCRSVIFYFRNTSAEAATVADLAAEVETQTTEEEIASQLHHSTLPRLEDAGIVEYDARSNTVRYLDPVDPHMLIDDIEALYQTVDS